MSPYADLHSGAVMNVTIGRYVYATIEPTQDGYVEFCSDDQGISRRYPAAPKLPLDGHLDLTKAIYNRIVREFTGGRALSIRISTHSEAPMGSGLGSSSTLVVAVLQAFVELLSLPLGEYDVAHLAFEIERLDLGQHGGRQDQYAATFGGFNFMEFRANDAVIVNPLRIKREVTNELESRVVLCYTGVSRESAAIIDEQSSNVRSGVARSIEAMHRLKESAIVVKEALLKGDLELLAKTMRDGWSSKRDMARAISNSHIEEALATAMASGASAGKISGAGGGGFMMLLTPLDRKRELMSTLDARGFKTEQCHFTLEGATAWRI